MANGIFNLKQVNQAIQQSAWIGQKPSVVNYLVVAGGGAGGGGYAGGGGGGGFLTGVTTVTAGSAITVTVGAGGTGNTSQGPNGSNSVFGSITAIGGGGGCSGQGTGSAGGSGGGNGGGSALNSIGSAVAGQGNVGGIGGGGTGPAPGGGGGAGSRGMNGNGEGPAGTGGYGAASAITGVVTAYAGGGGGGCYMRGANGQQGRGGAGGGGAGGDTGAPGGNGVAGTANTGGGGGGGSTNGSSSNGGNGGSGIVVISYPDTYAAAASTTGSPTVSTSGSGSLSFDGSTQWLTYASNAAWALGTTFTIEAWVYPTAFSVNNKRFFDTLANGSNGFGVKTDASGNVYLDSNSGSAGTSNPLTANTWTHLAVVVSSGTVTIYYNGTSQSVSGGTTGINVSATLGLTVGTYGTNGGFAFQGYMTNARIVKGTAVYTSNFTPSTTPLTAITNTQLLLSSVSGAPCADGSTNSFGASSSPSIMPTWNQSSPFTVLGYKNRVYKWTSSGSITF